MDNIRPPPTNPDPSARLPAHLDHSATSTSQRSWQPLDVTNGSSPCHSCLPLIHALFGGGLGQWAFPSPFPDYVYVPALVHKSQLAHFATHNPPSGPHFSGPSYSIPTPAPAGRSPSPPTPNPQTNQRRSRGVKIACTNCRLANKRCDEGRPCERCIKSGLEASCVSAERKQRRRIVRPAVSTTADVDSASPTPGEEGMSVPTSIHAAASASPYVDDSRDMADGASPSSSSSSPQFGPQPDTTPSKLDTFNISRDTHRQDYSMFTDIWAQTAAAYATAQHQQPQHQHQDSFSTPSWGDFDLGMGSHHPLVEAGFGHGLSPGGVGGEGMVFQCSKF